MKINGNRDICIHLAQRLDDLSKGNAAFCAIFTMLCNSEIEITIGSEQDLLNDSHNKSKTLTEFRGYHLPGDIHLFYTRYETMDSLVSMCLHELCHEAIRSNPLILMMFNVLNGAFLVGSGKKINISEPFWTHKDFEEVIKHDDVHDDIPEETICNAFATSLTETSYNRTWWRQNIRAIDDLN